MYCKAEWEGEILKGWVFSSQRVGSKDNVYFFGNSKGNVPVNNTV